MRLAKSSLKLLLASLNSLVTFERGAATSLEIDDSLVIYSLTGLGLNLWKLHLRVSLDIVSSELQECWTTWKNWCLLLFRTLESTGLSKEQRGSSTTRYHNRKIRAGSRDFLRTASSWYWFNWVIPQPKQLRTKPCDDAYAVLVSACLKSRPRSMMSSWISKLDGVCDETLSEIDLHSYCRGSNLTGFET